MDQHQPGSSARRLVRDGFQKLTLQSRILGLVLLTGYALVFLSQNVFHSSAVVDNLGLVAGRTIPFGYNVVTYAFVEDSFLSVRCCCCCCSPSHDLGADGGPYAVVMDAADSSLYRPRAGPYSRVPGNRKDYSRDSGSFRYPHIHHPIHDVLYPYCKRDGRWR